MRLGCAVLSLVLAVTAHADWTIQSSTSDPGRGGVVHTHVVLENDARNEGVTVDLAIFSTKSCTLRVLQNEGATDGLAEVMVHERCLAGVNGGYFDEKFAPIGLRIANGEVIAPLKRARLITGVLVASRRGVQIVRAREFSQRPDVPTAIQCGPFLVDRKKPIGGLNTANVARRTFAATTTGS